MAAFKIEKKNNWLELQVAFEGRKTQSNQRGYGSHPSLLDVTRLDLEGSTGKD